MRQKWGGGGGLWILNEIGNIKKNRGSRLEVMYLLNSTANPAQFEWKWAHKPQLPTHF